MDGEVIEAVVEEATQAATTRHLDETDGEEFERCERQVLFSYDMIPHRIGNIVAWDGALRQ